MSNKLGPGQWTRRDKAANLDSARKLEVAKHVFRKQDDPTSSLERISGIPWALSFPLANEPSDLAIDTSHTTSSLLAEGMPDVLDGGSNRNDLYNCS
jgi:hypothetical protein